MLGLSENFVNASNVLNGFSGHTLEHKGRSGPEQLFSNTVAINPRNVLWLGPSSTLSQYSHKSNTVVSNATFAEHIPTFTGHVPGRCSSCPCVWAIHVRVLVGDGAWH